MKRWEIIADNLSKAGWSWGCVSAINSNGQTIFGMRAPKSWALELPMAAPGYWKGNRAGGGAALPTSVTSNVDKVWVVYLQV